MNIQKIVSKIGRWTCVALKREVILNSEPGFPVLGQAVPAVDRPSFSGLEGDFALFAAV
jgi:hypothetical protein